MSQTNKPPALYAEQTGGDGSLESREGLQTTDFQTSPQAAPVQVGHLLPAIVLSAGLRSIRFHLANGDLAEAARLAEAVDLANGASSDRRAA